MSPVLLLTYLAAIAGGLLCIGGAGLVLYVAVCFVRGKMGRR